MFYSCYFIYFNHNYIEKIYIFENFTPNYFFLSKLKLRIIALKFKILTMHYHK